MGELENLEKMLGWGLTAKRYFIFMIKKYWGGVSDRVKIEKNVRVGVRLKICSPLYYILP